MPDRVMPDSIFETVAHLSEVGKVVAVLSARNEAPPPGLVESAFFRINPLAINPANLPLPSSQEAFAQCAWAAPPPGWPSGTTQWVEAERLMDFPLFSAQSAFRPLWRPEPSGQTTFLQGRRLAAQFEIEPTSPAL